MYRQPLIMEYNVQWWKSFPEGLACLLHAPLALHCNLWEHFGKTEYSKQLNNSRTIKQSWYEFPFRFYLHQIFMNESVDEIY